MLSTREQEVVCYLIVRKACETFQGRANRMLADADGYNSSSLYEGIDYFRGNVKNYLADKESFRAFKGSFLHTPSELGRPSMPALAEYWLIVNQLNETRRIWKTIDSALLKASRRKWAHRSRKCMVAVAKFLCSERFQEKILPVQVLTFKSEVPELFVELERLNKIYEDCGIRIKHLQPK